MQNFAQLSKTLGPVLAWTKETALPFWARSGIDAERGGFHERLDLSGRPVLDVPKRLMVQGRQLYVYASAAHLGWFPDGRELAGRCVEYMVRSYRRRDGEPGWIHSIAPDGTIANPTRDCYAHAFVLLGLAWYHRLTGDAQAVALIDETVAYLDEFAASNRGGYIDAVPPPDAIRRQNPHMHLFEAFLALYEAVGKPCYLAHGAELFGVFATGLFQPELGWLCEYLNEDLDPMPTRGSIIEPGHHYEWVWLLRWFERLSGKSVGRFCAALYEHADRFGWDHQNFVVDEIDPLGRVLKASRRSWPHTEALKANIVEAEAGRSGCDKRAAYCLIRLFDTFLGRPFAGGWIDRVDQNGAALAEFVPASTLYHVFCAVSEASRVALIEKSS